MTPKTTEIKLSELKKRKIQKVPFSDVILSWITLYKQKIQKYTHLYSINNRSQGRMTTIDEKIAYEKLDSAIFLKRFAYKKRISVSNNFSILQLVYSE